MLNVDDNPINLHDIDVKSSSTASREPSSCKIVYHSVSNRLKGMRHSPCIRERLRSLLVFASVCLAGLV